ncbi:MAG TPA: Crp/Fnr family transcriptional regulator [Burkholderiales bacterium]|nr:Crp/Fnr family transcriptional regulator [Burkholderiales bacterium]
MAAKQCIAIEDFLGRVPLFAGLAGDELARLAEGATQLEAPRGAFVFRRGDPWTGLHVVVCGQVKLSLHSRHGAEKVVELVGPGHSLGGSGLFLDRPHRASAEALTASKLIHIPKARVFAELEHHAGFFARRIIADLSRRLDHFLSDLESVTLRSGTERVVGYLLTNVQVCPRDGAAVTLPAAKGVIASRLSLTQEHFSRILHELAAAGLIGIDGRDIRIPDLDRLRARAA